MSTLKLLREHRAEIIRIVERHGGTNVRVHGSIKREEDTPDSDVDLIVDCPGLLPLQKQLAIASMTGELEPLFQLKFHIHSTGVLRLSTYRRIEPELIPL